MIGLRVFKRLLESDLIGILVLVSLLKLSKIVSVEINPCNGINKSCWSINYDSVESAKSKSACICCFKQDGEQSAYVEWMAVNKKAEAAKSEKNLFDGFNYHEWLLF